MSGLGQIGSESKYLSKTLIYPRLVHVSMPRSFLKHYLLFIYFIINDVILTSFHIIFSTWLYNYFCNIENLCGFAGLI